jgi:hypothetical protein
MAEPDFEALVRGQLAMNAQTWKLLLERGVTTQTNLKLDFFFNAPNRKAAESLISLMNDETDYELSQPRSAGPVWRREWSVSGSTQATKVSLDILNQWVIWMIMVGKRSAGCVFDGWGTEVPNP